MLSECFATVCGKLWRLAIEVSQLDQSRQVCGLL